MKQKAIKKVYNLVKDDRNTNYYNFFKRHAPK